MNGFMVSIIVDAFTTYNPLHPHWFIDWCAAVDDAQFRLPTIGTDCHLEVKCLQTNTVVLKLKNHVNTRTNK